MPGCETVADWDIGYCYNQASIMQKLMFNDSTKTTLAACVGHLSGAYDFQHEAFARILLEERLNAEPGMTVAEVVWRAVREAQKIPCLTNYARSVCVMGGYVKLPALTYASISDTSIPKESSCEISLSILPNPARPISGLEVEVLASRAVPGSLAIYDVRGRLVDRIHSGMIREGRNVFSWQMRDSRGNRVTAGIYFVRLSHPGGAVSNKIVVAE